MNYLDKYEIKEYAGIDKSGWIILAVTFVVAALFMQVSLISYIIGYLTILIHEFGHFTTRMLFGYPSVPAFDFREGGGVTAYTTRVMWITLLPFGGLGYVLYFVRKHFLSVIIVSITIVFYALLAFSDKHNELCILAGHGAEIIIAGVFLYRAMSGASIVNPNERPLYAFCGWSMLLYSGGFFFKLLTDKVEMINYRMGKSYVENDLVKIEQLHRFMSVKLQCICFIILCLAIPFAAFGINLFFKRIKAKAIDQEADESD